MTPDLPGRAGQMGRSLSSAARAQAASEADVEALGRAFGLAMAPRLEALDDDHHPAYLHPGRSALILLRDVGAVDVSVLILACLHESVDESWRVPPEEIQATLGAAAVRAMASIPLPGDERLAERLLTLGPGLSLAAVAERLDHLRHLHQREDLLDLWAGTYEEVVATWLPFARRVHPRL
ncbi:MAG: hypothetical protein GWN71_01690, partial [Gammaproteobacteria bacterium]|nr:hypothetical protein [Actinomycetota bacterium]NIU72326.1 hypothetical protein [Gammaproteobacteria bacterium]